MKKLVLSAALLIGASMALLSCNNGDYDANPNTNNSGTGVPSNHFPGSGNGGGGGAFDWSGTDPVSAKIDGNAFQATTAFASSLNGTLAVQAAGASVNNLSLAIPENTAAGATISLGTTTYIAYVEGMDMYSSVTGGSGSIKVLENDATHIKGLFYGTVKSLNGGKTKTVTEGYFNVKK